MCKISGLLGIISLFSVILFSNALPNSKTQKKQLIEEIIQKVSKLSMKSIAHSPPKEKSRLLQKIETKLIKSGKSLGPKKNKYIKFIMKGLVSKAYDDLKEKKVIEKIVYDNPVNDKTLAHNSNEEVAKHKGHETIIEHSDDNAAGQNHDNDVTGQNYEDHGSGQNQDDAVTGKDNDDHGTSQNHVVDAPGQNHDVDVTEQNYEDHGTDQNQDDATAGKTDDSNRRRQNHENGSVIKLHGPDTNDEPPINDVYSAVSNPDNNKIVLKQNPDNITESENEYNNKTNTMTKEKLINAISKKLSALINGFIKEVETKEARQRAIQSIKERFKNTAKDNKKLHSKSPDIKTYVELIGKGVKVMMQQAVNANEIPTKNTRRIASDTDDIIVNKLSNEEVKYRPTENNGLVNYNDISLAGNVKKPVTMLFKLDQVKNSKLNLTCDEDVKETCSRIKLLNTFKCEKDKNFLHISKICDGKADCSDSSDENNCARQALECVQNAARIMSHIDLSISHDCYKGLQENGIVFKQNEVYRKVLQKQLAIIQKHISLKFYTRRVFKISDSLKNTVNEVTAVINALTAALKAIACDKENIDKALNESTPIKMRTFHVEVTKNISWSPAMCHCNEQHCIKTCSEGCEDICWQKYSLGQFQCQAVNGERYVTLDMVCDGKLDCIDETDENKCFEENSVTKYEATEMYNYILKLILDKTSLRQYEAIRNDLLSLHGLITKLQKLSLNHYDINVSEVKRVRETCFKQMTSIYSNTLRLLPFPEEAMRVYLFLLSLNEMIISAMKRSHIGNDKIIATKECVCRGYECASQHCSKSCKRACMAEPKLTRYFCSGSTIINNSVPMEALCDGKQNCPGGDDEENCKKEVCRSHHLKVLRLNIRDVGIKYQGTSLGEALISWKKKATSTLQHTEGEIRPTRHVIHDVLSEILHELVKSYADIEDYRRGNSKAFDEFLLWSRVVIDVARSCT